jgi:L-serine dehydratase
MPKSLFDILGPVMIGPSSSHTAGAVRIGLVARQIAGGDFRTARCLLHGSFARTYKGHGTDIALAAGLLGMSSEDDALRDAKAIAQSRDKQISFETADLGEVHENTVRITMEGEHGKYSLTGSSVGGGNIHISEVNGFDTDFTADAPTVVTVHKDLKGVVSEVSRELAQGGVNIANMRLSRQTRGGTASMVIECDTAPGESVMEKLRSLSNVITAIDVAPV